MLRVSKPEQIEGQLVAELTLRRIRQGFNSERISVYLRSWQSRCEGPGLDRPLPTIGSTVMRKPRGL
jgi:hypothetical protein